MTVFRKAAFAAGILGLSISPTGFAQESSNTITPAGPIREDARSHLRPGYLDPGVAALNLELVANSPRPEGFYDAQSPQGTALPDRFREDVPKPATPPAPPPKSDAPKEDPAAREYTAGPGEATAFSNSDIGLAHGLAVVGNFHGFNLYDVHDPDKLQLVASVVCPGGQGDVSIYGNLVFMSVEATIGRLDCGTTRAAGAVNPERFRGVRVFDVSDLKGIRQVAAIQTCRGSHTHTLVPDRRDPHTLYIYSSGTVTPRPAEELAGCSGKKPEEDPNTSLYSIDVIKLSLDAPEKAAVIDHPRVFADPKTGALNGLWSGADHGPGTQKLMVKTTDLCHDITAFPDAGIAAAACGGNGLLLDISNPAKPVRLDAANDPNFAFWHAAIFNNDATKVIFSDEWGSGVTPRCRSTDPANWGADIVLDIVNRKFVPRAYYKIPAAFPSNVNCVAHNGALIPVPGRDIAVQAWYAGGTSVFDFTDSAHPKEIAYFDRGPINPNGVILSGDWSSTWYNGRIYSTEIARGLDVFKLKPSEFLTKNEIAAAELVSTEGNAQTQRHIVWPNHPVVARAYLDQLMRDNAIAPARASVITAALDSIEQHKAKTGAYKDLAKSLEQDAKKASGREGERLKGIAHILNVA